MTRFKEDKPKKNKEKEKIELNPVKIKKKYAYQPDNLYEID